MSVFEDRLPYSQKRLEDLAIALGVNSAYLCVSPVTNALSLREEAEEKLPTSASVDVDLLDQGDI